MEAIAQGLFTLALLESVRCLECGEVYSKPVQGGTTHKNPGCPLCGYVGWIPISVPHERSAPARSGGGRQPRRFARSH